MSRSIEYYTVFIVWDILPFTNILVTELTTGGSMVKLKKMAQFFAFLGRVRSFSIALTVENASLTAIVTR